MSSIHSFRKKTLKPALRWFTSSLLLFCLLSANAAQSDVDTELQNLIKIFGSDDFTQQRRNISALEWSGISDPALFDIISNKLSENSVIDNKVAREQAAWFAKALALSGNEKYRSQLSALSTGADSKKVRKHAKVALTRLDIYARWNPVISQNVVNAATGKLHQARVINMLQAEDYHLVRIGAKRVHHAHSDNHVLLQKASDRLLADLDTDEYEGVQVDAMAWLIKALAQSRDARYKTSLESVLEASNNKKLKKFAKKFLGHFEE